MGTLFPSLGGKRYQAICTYHQPGSTTSHYVNHVMQMHRYNGNEILL